MSVTFDLISHTPESLGFYLPTEWGFHACCWMAWPVKHVQWDNIERVERDYANIANTISEFEPVTMIVDPVNIERARQLCHNRVEVLEIPNNDSWTRDTGPTFLKHRETGQLAGVNWRFNCWGGYYPDYHEDAQLASRILNYLKIPIYHSSLTLEGGAIHVDGQGTLVTIESCALNLNRNWGLDKAAAEKELSRATGATNIIWLSGDPDSEMIDMTDGHVDGIMCFIKPGVILFERYIGDDPVYSKLEKENRRALELATDARGNKFEIIDLVIDHSDIGQGQELFCDSYVNFYFANGGIVMPSYGVAADQKVHEILSSLFPDRKVVMVNINAIAPGGGGIHCMTQQQPA